MDFVPPQLDGAVKRSQTYALQGERDDTYTMDAQKIPRSFTNNLVANQTTGSHRYFNTIGEHGWARYVLDEMKDMLLLLRPDGMVLYASPSCKSVTGYNAQQMEQNVLSRFIHDDDKQIFAYELEESIAMARPLRCHFRFYRPNNTFCIMEAHGHPHITALTHACSGVFLVCRPYPTRSSTLIDSFLEHKIENIRLRQCIARLKEEEEEEELSASRQEYTNGNPSQFYNSHDATGSGEEDESPDSVYNDDSDSITFIRHDSEKLSPTEDTSHIDGIEVMTGLYYGDGERSQGLSTGLRNGRLVHCDIDMAALEQQAQAQAQARIAQDNSDRRKRLKGEYMCSDCGTSESPEWRKGPEGPKTLCNACGLRWAKREKKRQEPN